jgi:hypothetical protein
MNHMMTKRERVLRTIRFEETDRVPLYDIIQCDPVIEHYAGRTLTVEDGERTVGIAVGRTLDMVRAVSGPNRPRTETNPDGFEIRNERWTSWIVSRPFTDFDGFTAWVKDQIGQLDALTFTDAFRNELHDTVRRHSAAFAEGDPTGRMDPTVFVLESGIGLTEMYHAPGMELFVELMMTDPGLVEEWFDARNRAELRKVAVIANPELIPVALVYDDIACKNGPMFAPDWLRQYWVGGLRKLVEAWHSRGTYCLFHSDGNLWSVLDDLVACGIDGLNPLEVMADMTVGAVRQRYPRLFLTGGIDVSQLLTYGTPGEVRAACQQAIADTSGCGYFLGSSTELHWDVPLANAQAMFETAWATQKT